MTQPWACGMCPPGPENLFVRAMSIGPTNPAGGQPRGAVSPAFFDTRAKFHFSLHFFGAKHSLR